MLALALQYFGKLPNIWDEKIPFSAPVTITYTTIPLCISSRRLKTLARQYLNILQLIEVNDSIKIQTWTTVKKEREDKYLDLLDEEHARRESFCNGSTK